MEYVACSCTSCATSYTTFIHVYKAAGSFLNRRLEESCGGHTRCWSSFADKCYNMAVDHQVPSFHPCAQEALRLVYQEGFVFSVVREPISRFISGMHELKRRSVLGEHTTLSELLQRVEEEGFFNPHIYPQYTFLVSPASTKTGFPLGLVPLELDYIAKMNEVEQLELVSTLRDLNTHMPSPYVQPYPIPPCVTAPQTTRLPTLNWPRPLPSQLNKEIR